ncbi:hypothetical protein IF2G_01616 [Cordyceps javanica]|nr:hypothetical protein IF2G_01616 [Cordyceps javanica]
MNDEGRQAWGIYKGDEGTTTNKEMRQREEQPKSTNRWGELIEASCRERGPARSLPIQATYYLRT